MLGFAVALADLRAMAVLHFCGSGRCLVKPLATPTLYRVGCLRPPLVVWRRGVGALARCDVGIPAFSPRTIFRAAFLVALRCRLPLPPLGGAFVAVKSQIDEVKRLPNPERPSARVIPEATGHIKIVCCAGHPESRSRADRNWSAVMIFFIKRNSRGGKIEDYHRQGHVEAEQDDGYPEDLEAPHRIIRS